MLRIIGDRDPKRKNHMPIKSILTAVAILGISGTAAAHPKLVAVDTKTYSSLGTPAHIDLHFSEKLLPAFSKGGVTMDAMPGMPAMKVLSTASLTRDGKTLVIKPEAKLASGRYIVDWHVVSTDTHKVAGSYKFTVK